MRKKLGCNKGCCYANPIGNERVRCRSSDFCWTKQDNLNLPTMTGIDVLFSWELSLKEVCTSQRPVYQQLFNKRKTWIELPSYVDRTQKKLKRWNSLSVNKMEWSLSSQFMKQNWTNKCSSFRDIAKFLFASIYAWWSNVLISM